MSRTILNTAFKSKIDETDAIRTSENLEHGALPGIWAEQVR